MLIQVSLRNYSKAVGSSRPKDMASAFPRTLAVSISNLADEQTEQSFSFKVLSNDIGRNMVHGEFESMKAIYSQLLDLVPKQIAWDTYQSNPDTQRFLCEYREMTDDMLDSEKFSAQLALLHKNSESPTGKFGFHITTYSGNLPN
ncbi:uncharacterized protein Z519_04995 [Cladophialophora bantiana CBS 173.52]|uniref:Protein-ribulosamine 3-kinase n=1 Tax=Cladophialophora bantiana (strain ATCC 10958 / CBS 173.52 / CDC B-1940 / NIH 8579) TaxID=1442370 RepID=A0A0D2HVS3_CLAB1|nr:uncharacterized protein Z519_04995 [Cladophialophora bantiana CBS 173.52]KIW95015.1 hypothetical protein Z519_04995 [Cladophialophora bantiana CBS 173.52]